MYLCKIENGTVSNRAKFDDQVPDGWIPDGETWIANDEAQIGWLYADGMFSEPPPPPPEPTTSEDVNAERDRRTFPGPILVTSTALPRPIPVDMRVEKDRENLGDLTTGAVIAKGFGKTGTYVNFGDADNNVTPLTADQVIVLGTAGLTYGSLVWEASRALKKMDPIPLDFRDDKYWPVPAVTI